MFLRLAQIKPYKTLLFLWKIIGFFNYTGNEKFIRAIETVRKDIEMSTAADRKDLADLEQAKQYYKNIILKFLA